MKIDDALALIREIPDFPKPEIRFQDITPLLAHAQAFSVVTKRFAEFAHEGVIIAGIEARGFIFASALAHATNSGFVPIRKAGKLPYSVISQSYGLEYGSDTLELHTDAIAPGSEVLLIDDVLATGGTICAAIDLVQRSGASVIHVVTLLEIAELSGRAMIIQRFPGTQITSLVAT